MEIFEINRALDAIFRVGNEAIANTITNYKANEAQEYCQKYLMPQSLGQNMWHAILDDAIRMRKEKE